MADWHKVEKNELTTVMNWLEPFLPESWKVYATIRETLAGRWQGQPFYTLGWPDIRGVVEGPPETDHPCPDYHKHQRIASLFAPDDRDCETILRCPFFYDWTRTVIVLGMPTRIKNIALKIVDENGCRKVHCDDDYVLMAYPGDVEPRPVPENFKFRRLNKEKDLEHCVASWQHARQSTEQYTGSLIDRMPTVCLADRNDLCVSFEVGTEYGSLGMLHTREAYRGQGLAKVVVSLLAQEYFRVNLPVVSCVEIHNTLSLRLHLSLGFKNTETQLTFFISEP